MITFASRVKLWKRATGGCFVCCLESEEGNLDRMKFEEKFFLPPGPLGRIDWDTPRVLLSFVNYRRIHREFVSHRRHQNFPFSSSHSQISHVWSMIYLLLNLFLNLELHRRSRYWTQPIYLCWGTNEKNYQKKSWALSPDVIQHVGRKKRWGWFLLQQWNTQNWWQAPLCNRAHCYILQCPISGLRKMYNGGWDERELIEKELSKKRKARFPLFFARINLFAL